LDEDTDMIAQGDVEFVKAEAVGSINSPFGDLTGSNSKISIEKI
jgi:hypothetical protein